VNENDLEQLRLRINDAAGSIASGKSFRAFDRMEFLRTFADPLYRSLVEIRLRSGIKHPAGASGINFAATSLFAGDFFKMDFYGPSSEHGVTPARIRLGKKLFSDPILSGEKNRSCASCHDPNKGFSDGLAKPYAIDDKTLLARNSPTLWNAGLQTRQFWDSRVDLLENQLGEVVHNLQEMQGSLGNAVNDLKGSAEYSSLFRDAYPAEKENINRFTIANSIASYVRSLRSLDSRFDKYISGRTNDYSASEKNGFNLFMGKAKCGTCHFLPLFNGVVPPLFYETESEVLGVPATKNRNSPMLDGDRGKFDFTKAEIHRFAFKTPTIRNIALTAPFMHNGVFNTLEEVIDFYNEGGGTGLGIAPPNQTLPPGKLDLSKKEKADLIRFLHSLTDTSAAGINY
jgi:cytochrome c peroxidase